MSRPAPHFSATVIDSNTWADASEDGEVVPSLFETAVSKKVFFNARSVNAATSTMPAPVIQTAHGKVFHVPMRMVISAANPLKPGIPIDAADAMTNANAANGN